MSPAAPVDFTLYTAAVQADQKFEAELVRAYGKGAASMRRYQFAPHVDAAVQAALVVKLAADEAWLVAMRAAK